MIVDGRQIVDGDKGFSEGITLTDLSRLMADLGCKAAYNLDGGGSAKMYFNGDVITNCSNNKRVISDIIFLSPAWMQPSSEASDASEGEEP